jgi:hypothetical protein
MKRVYSVNNVVSARFKTVDLGEGWREAIGTPELRGTWFVYGPPKNGKTSFGMMLARRLAGFRRLAYNSVEEGLSLTIKLAMERAGIAARGSGIVLLKMDFATLMEYSRRPKSPGVVVIDSVQFMGLTFEEYKQLKSTFPEKLFVYISHVEGRIPDGTTARRIWRDAAVTFRVEGFRAHPVSRYGGGESLVVSEEMAGRYWGENDDKE